MVLQTKSTRLADAHRRRRGWSRLRINRSLVGLCLGAAEWGTPWDWQDYRLNTFGLLTLLALFLVLGRQSQPDGVETRDTFSTFGLYGFVLVPITYIATRIWVIRHPGPVIAGEDGSSISGDMATVLMIGAISFTLLIAGHI